jgi:hypothetical protein
MTTPIELLIERLNEVSEVIRSANKNKLNKDTIDELKNIYNQYKSSIDLLRYYLDEDYEPKILKVYRKNDYSKIAFVDVKNMRSSRYEGVTYNKMSKKFQAYYHLNKKKIHLGYFNTDTEAYIRVQEHKKLRKLQNI